MADPLGDFAAEVRRLADAAVRAVAGENSPALPVETPGAGQADLALACFPLAKVARRNPVEIAQQVAAQALAARAGPSMVAKIEAQGGYVNFFVDRLALAKALLPVVLAQKERFGELPRLDRRLILEHTSANPNGPLHVGRARNPIIGDTLVRINRKAGWNVESQYYLDDIGKQVAILAWGTLNLQEADLPPTESPKVDHKIVRYYQAANERMERDKGVEASIQVLVQKSEIADAATMRVLEAAYEPVLEGMKESLARIGVRFDSFVKESDFIANKDTERIIERLQKTEVSREETDGALFLDLSGYGIHGRSQRFVYRRSDGTSLYATRDVAYHFWKGSKADRLINVLGEDHKLQAQQVRICLELLGCKTLPEVVFYAFVSLPEGKMSTRRNRVVYLDDLIAEAVDRAYDEVKRRRGTELDEGRLRQIAEAVGIGALRFNIVRVQPEKGITFKWEEALSFEGASAPFLQYALARCSSLLKKAGVDHPSGDADLLSHASELELMRQIARLPRAVDDAARRDAPHVIATYAQELASALNAFYRDCPVLAAESPTLRQNRLALVAAAKYALHSTLALLGVPILDEM